MSRTGTASEPSQRAAAHTSTTSSDDSSWAAELASVFATEFEEYLDHVRALAALLTSPDTQAIGCAKLSRIFHTIKGSAAVVGRSDLSALAKRLQDDFGAAAERSEQRPLSTDFLMTVQQELDALCTAAGREAPRLLHPLPLARSDRSDVDQAATVPEPSELQQAFSIDAAEAIGKSQRLLLELERYPRDVSISQQLLRHFHTLKGAAAAVGLNLVAQQLHHGESLLDAVIGDRVTVDVSELVDFLLRLIDSVAGLIDAARGMAHAQRPILGDVEAEVAALMSKTGSITPALPPVAACDIPTAQSYAADSDTGRLWIDGTHLDTLLDQVGQLLAARNRITRRVEALSELRDRFGDYRARLSQAIATFRDRFEFTSNNARAAETAAPLPEPSVVALDRYDEVSLLARAVVESAATSRQITDQLTDAIDGLADETAQLSQTTSSLRHGITRLRSIALDTVFQRLVRAVRDAARQEGKLVDLQLQGGGAELDKALVARLHAPLLHLVRNAVSHGIEPPAARQTRGKPATGTVRIAATLQDKHLLLSVEDDGAGIDFAAIAARGRAMRLIPPGETWNREQLLSLAFRSGFSTRPVVTDLAGRGVGMDVVVTDIEAMNGSVTIDSRDGLGTTVRIALPITTSIDEVLLVQAGTQLFGLPIAYVDRVLPIDIADLGDRTPHSISVDGEELATLVLGPLVGEPAPLEHATAVVLRVSGRTVALVVDHVQAQHEAVVRPLGRMLDPHPLLAGVVVSGTGAVILVLRSDTLLELATSSVDLHEPLESLAARSAAPPRGQAILFVDDSISVRKVATHFLENSGRAVVTAVDGLDAIEKLASGRFGVVVTDLEMPRMHGYELIAAMRRHAVHHHLPVIVCSSRTSDKHRQRAYQLGAQGYLTKPFTQDQLLAEIDRLAGPLQVPLFVPANDATSHHDRP